MRWSKTQVQEGDVRKRRGFLLWPTTINGETRWLEWASWNEKAHRWYDGVGGGLYWTRMCWTN
jgi:hypothetical protein